MDLERKTKLEYYKLKETFSGSISLRENIGIYDPQIIKPKTDPAEEQKSPLEEIIEQINEANKGEFTQGDRVIIGDLYDRMTQN